MASFVCLLLSNTYTVVYARKYDIQEPTICLPGLLSSNH